MRSSALGSAVLVVLALGLFACGGGSDSTEAVPGFGVDAATLALWHFDEGSGQTAHDASPYARHLTLGSTAGGDADDPAWTAGHLEGCLSYTRAEGDHASGAHAVTLPTNQVSVEFWYRTQAAIGMPFAADPYVLTFVWGGGGFSFGIGDGAVTRSLDLLDPGLLSTLADGNWHYVAGTYDGATMALYLDGRHAVSRPMTIATIPEITAFHVGSPDGSPSTEGEIDEVRVSARAISAEEIGAHWAAYAP